MRISLNTPITSIAAVTGLVAALLLTTAPPGVAAAAPVVARNATLTTHETGYPVVGTPAARQLVSASVSVDVVKSRVKAQLTLAAVPDAGTASRAVVSLGRYRIVDGTQVCSGDEYETADTVAPSDGATRSGTVITLDRDNTSAGGTPWDCVFVAMIPTDASTPIYDVLIGDLTPVLGAEPAPAISVTGVQVLQKKVTKLRLVRGTRTTLHVAVANADGAADANGLFVSGSGKGLKVTTSPVNGFPISEGTSNTLEVTVKLTGKKRPGPLTLVAHSGTTTATTTLRVKSVAAAATARPGSYRDKKTGVSFRIKGGKVVGFRAGPLQTRCGGFPGNFTYQSATYDHPTTRIGRDGLVDDEDLQELFVTDLQLKVVGGKVSQGYFAYYGPDRCFASVDFRAKATR